MSRIVLFIIFLLLLLVFFGYIMVVAYVYPEMESRSQFGDMFGGIGALFSGLAFLGVIYTVLLQKEELGLQRRELELTRIELKRTAEAQEKSEKALGKQAASQKISARLNGLSAMLQFKSSLMEIIAIGKYGDSGIDQRLKAECEGIVAEIQKIIRDK